MPPRAQLEQKNDIAVFLRQVGLSEKEAAVYLAALKLGNALVKDIAKQARLNRTTTYNLLLGLRKMGLVASYQKRGLVHFSAVTPDRLEDLLDKRIEEQERLKDEYRQLLPNLKTLFHSHAHGSKIKMYEGLNSFASIYYDLYDNMRYPGEGLELTNWGGKEKLFPERTRNEAFEKMKKAGIHTRSILVEDSLTRGWVKEGMGKTMQKEIRLIPNPGWDFFVNVEMFRNKVALVTYRDDVDFQGILIESPEMAGLLRLLFETLWQNSGSHLKKVS